MEDDHKCFVCGPQNQDGLRLDWKVEGSIMTTRFVPETKYQGWKGVVHGGILATLLDEAMARLAGILYGPAVTAEMTIRYLIPAFVGKPVFIRGEVVKDSRRIVEMKAVIYAENEEGAMIAHATGKVIKVAR